MSQKIIVITTGGTIASTPGNDGRNIAGALPGDVLLQEIDLQENIELEVISLLQKPSNAITPDDLLKLRAECLTAAQRPDVTGIVVTHGTDTLEDTAYFLECTLNVGDTPIIVTGSQRVPHVIGSDVYTNLRHAILSAATPAVRGLGVVVVFNETLFSASTVRKVNSYQLHAFMSPGYGCLGYIDDDIVYLQQRPVRLLPPVETGPSLPRVDILGVHLGASADLIDACIKGGAKGIVIEGVGRGHVPPDWMEGIARAIQAGVVVLICTSCTFGPVHQSYEFPGSLHELERAGVIPVGDLNARKARLRLMACLSKGTPTLPHLRLALQHTSQAANK